MYVNKSVIFSILKQISPEYSLEGLMLKLNLQYFGHMMQRTDSLEKTLMLGKIEGRRRREREDEMVGWHHQLNGHEFEPSSKSWWWTGRPGVLQSMGLQRVRHYWAMIRPAQGQTWVSLPHSKASTPSLVSWPPVSLPSKPSYVLQSDRSSKNANLTVSTPFLLPPPQPRRTLTSLCVLGHNSL